MTNLTTINFNDNTKIKEATTKRNEVPFEIVNPKLSNNMLEAFAEINEMITNPEKYSRYNNREDLKKALLSND